MPANIGSVRVPISFDGWYGVLSAAIGLLPSLSYVNVESDTVEVEPEAFKATMAASQPLLGSVQLVLYEPVALTTR